ncbi:FtsX-like permease family protein [Nocardia sp. NPDC005366]|uniref:FtsX-like permease family protein n=1 Tax=Nocardia sp. NPDC005366 TaxID=3156878 RepID=UPI0033A8B084
MMWALADRARVFSLREFWVHRGRTFASMTVMAVSAAFLVAVLGLTGSITGSIARLVDGIAGDAALEISGITDSGLPQQISEQVAAVPGVAAAVPMVRTTAPSAGGPVLLLGVDGNGTALHSDVAAAVRAQLAPLLTVPNGVLVGPGLGYDDGDSFTLGSGTVTVAGVLRDSSVAALNQGHYVLAPLPLAQYLIDRTGRLDSILVTLRPGADESAVRTAVTDVVAGRAVVGDPIQRAAHTGNAVKIVRYMTLMGATAAFVVAAFLIYTAMTMAITQRRPVISMLRAIGGRRRTIVGDLLVEAALLGLVGGSVGAGIGILMGRVAVTGLPNVLMQAVEARTEYLVPISAIPIAVAASICTSIAASAVAAHQVYKVSPIEALAPVGASVADRIPRWLRIGAFAQAVVCAGAAITIVASGARTLAFSAVALALFFGAGMALCFAFAEPVLRATAGAAGLFGAPGALAAVSVGRSPRRVWATVMTVVMAVAITVTITGSNHDLLTSARGSLSSVAEADAWLASNAPDELPVGPLLPADLAGRVAAVPGVARVTPGQLAFATLGDSKVLLDGLAEGTDNPLLNAVDDRVRDDVLAGRGVVLSRDLGAALDVRVGDTLELRTPHGVRRITVLQLVSYFSVLAGTVGMSLHQVREWFDRPGETTLQIDALPGADTDRMLAEIRAIAPAGVHVFTGGQSLAGIESALRQGSAVSNAMWIIVVLIAAVALLNTLTLSVLERRREIGVLRALGSSRRFTLRTILAEAAGIGVVGGVLGLLFGSACQYFYDTVTPGILNFDVAYRPSPTVLYFGLAALALSLLGSIPPAVRAGRVDIIEAIGAD